MDGADDDEICLDSEVPGLTIALAAVAVPPPPPAIAPAPGFGDDEWAGRLADGRVLAFLREPVARCHLDRLLLVDGERRIEHPLPAWVYYGHLLALARRGLLVGGARAAWLVGGDGAMTTLLDEPDGDGVHVCWLADDTAVAAGWRTIVLDGPSGRATLPCNHAVGACVVAPELLVVSDDDGSQWIDRGRVVARDWRPYAAARGDVILSTAGDAYRVRVRRELSAG
ncbi:MAG: hypothetical protein JWM53_971 [bacterium]|nr:hypothetical protein [bacterium]